MNHSPFFRSHSMCDFCDARPIGKIYDAAPVFTVFAGERILFPDTKWSACASCATLIDQGRWGDLTDRCAEIWLKDMRARGVHIGYLGADKPQAGPRTHACLFPGGDGQDRLIASRPFSRGVPTRRMVGTFPPRRVSACLSGCNGLGIETARRIQAPLNQHYCTLLLPIRDLRTRLSL